MPSRRRLLAALGAVPLAGCSSITGDPSPDEPPEPGRDTEVTPKKHIHGGDGEWSSFGCNASNTRIAADGRAPVDGVTERWRVEVPQTTQREPIVVDGRVYHCTVRLDVYDAADGTELWSHPDAETTPAVRDGTVYVGAGERLLVLDAETGDTERALPLAADSRVGAPAAIPGDGVYVPAGETIYKVDPETREVEWSRDAFGRILGPPAYYGGGLGGVAFATRAGKVYLLGRNGEGWAEWSLPATPKAPPTADVDAIYVNCLDGETYGLDLGEGSQFDVDWNTWTGLASAGIAADEFVYAAGGSGLVAVDPESGDRLWEHDVGDWHWTAPALDRDTLFVGGDALYALDPTPGSGPPNGPAVRFERSYYGRVGPGPVLDDGDVYVVAETAERTYHLLALE